VPDHEVRPNAGRLHGPQAGDRGRDQRRLLELGARQVLERALEAEAGDVEAHGLRGLVVNGPRLGEALGDRPSHADVLRALPRKAERDLHLSGLPFVHVM
jgi:hypothetical protein